MEYLKKLYNDRRLKESEILRQEAWEKIDKEGAINIAVFLKKHPNACYGKYVTPRAFRRGGRSTYRTPKEAEDHLIARIHWESKTKEIWLAAAIKAFSGKNDPEFIPKDSRHQSGGSRVNPAAGANDKKHMQRADRAGARAGVAGDIAQYYIDKQNMERDLNKNDHWVEVYVCDKGCGYLWAVLREGSIKKGKRSSGQLLRKSEANYLLRWWGRITGINDLNGDVN